jgi:hypothetical protein
MEFIPTNHFNTKKYCFQRGLKPRCHSNTTKYAGESPRTFCLFIDGQSEFLCNCRLCLNHSNTYLMNIFNNEYSIIDKISDLMSIEVDPKTFHKFFFLFPEFIYSASYEFFCADALSGVLQWSIPESYLHWLLLESRHLQRVQKHLQEFRWALEEISNQQNRIAGHWHIPWYELINLFVKLIQDWLRLNDHQVRKEMASANR